MLSHIVIFRTRDKSKLPLLLEGLETLKQIDGVAFFNIGSPVPSDRPVVDDFFDFALNVCFADGKEGLARYATHPIHVNFVENYLKPAGAKLQVFDFEQ